MAHSKSLIDVVDKERITDVPRLGLFVDLLVQDLVIFKYLLHGVLILSLNLWVCCDQIGEITRAKILSSLTDLRLREVLDTLSVWKNVRFRFAIEHGHLKFLDFLKNIIN